MDIFPSNGAALNIRLSVEIWLLDPRFLNHGGPAVYADGVAPWGMTFCRTFRNVSVVMMGHLVMFPTGLEILHLYIHLPSGKLTISNAPC